MLRVQSKVLADKRLFCRFGMMTLLLNFIPLVGLLFSFTNTPLFRSFSQLLS